MSPFSGFSHLSIIDLEIPQNDSGSALVSKCHQTKTDSRNNFEIHFVIWAKLYINCVLCAAICDDSSSSSEVYLS